MIDCILDLRAKRDSSLVCHKFSSREFHFRDSELQLLAAMSYETQHPWMSIYSLCRESFAFEFWIPRWLPAASSKVFMIK
ncbi:hypothetical protein Nepgr_010170 [Nepenthes gracilis]|uniref:Uncharacterized protein n=1 Tax=Nepenthes gracilis TaxID=150966 RepID=A0AAD3SBW6_NEPGR|nr:hypothetical protein Nepgr_010170 [Nepenthes gracilis]